MTEKPESTSKRSPVINYALLAVFLAGVWFWSVRNSYLTCQSAAAGSITQMEDHFRRQAALLPNFLAYAAKISHADLSAFGDLKELHATLLSAKNLDEKRDDIERIEKRVSELLGKIHTLGIDKKASFLDWSDEFNSLGREMKLDGADYNAHIAFYNEQLQKTPNKWVARALGFQPMKSIDLGVFPAGLEGGKK